MPHVGCKRPTFGGTRSSSRPGTYSLELMRSDEAILADAAEDDEVVPLAGTKLSVAGDALTLEGDADVEGPAPYWPGHAAPPGGVLRPSSRP